MRTLKELKEIVQPTIQDLIEYYTIYYYQAHSNRYHDNGRSAAQYETTVHTLRQIQASKVEPKLKIKEEGKLGSLDLICPRTKRVLGVWWVPSHSLKMYGKMGSRDIVYKNLEPEKLIYFLRKAFKIEIKIKRPKTLR